MPAVLSAISLAMPKPVVPFRVMILTGSSVSSTGSTGAGAGSTGAGAGSTGAGAGSVVSAVLSCAGASVLPQAHRVSSMAAARSMANSLVRFMIESPFCKKITTSERCSHVYRDIPMQKRRTVSFTSIAISVSETKVVFWLYYNGCSCLLQPLFAEETGISLPEGGI